MKHVLLLLLSANLAFAASSPSPSPPPGTATVSERLKAFFEETFEAHLARHPMEQARLGLKTNYDQWDDYSDTARVAEMAAREAELARLKKEFAPDQLEPADQLSYELFEREVARAREAFPFRQSVYRISQMRGVHTELPTFLINVHKVENPEDARAYIVRLRGIPAVFDAAIADLEESAQQGVVPPKFVFPLVLDACRRIIAGAPFEKEGSPSPLLEDFTKKLDALKDLPAPAREKLLKEARLALETAVAPAYRKLMASLEALEKKATDDVGVWRFEKGADYYRILLRHTTTTDLSADEIHAIGLREVARIQKEMTAIKEAVGFKGTLPEFFKFMREDNRFYAANSEKGRARYLAQATSIIDTMRGRLDELFLTKPKANCVVKAVEPFREKSAGKAFYQRPAADGSRPGMFYVNLSDMKNTPLYSLEALAYHEGIPGHHMQIAIAQELTGLPRFRRFTHAYTAYVEGWALYSELIPKEIGLYQDPVLRFRPALARTLAGGPAGGRYRPAREEMVARPGNQIPCGKYAERADRLHRRDQSLHRDAGAGDGLQNRDAAAGGAAGPGQKEAGRKVRPA